MHGSHKKKCNNYPLPELSIPRWHRFHNGNMHRRVRNYSSQAFVLELGILHFDGVMYGIPPVPDCPRKFGGRRYRRAFKCTYTSLITVIVCSVYETAYYRYALVMHVCIIACGCLTCLETHTDHNFPCMLENAFDIYCL